MYLYEQLGVSVNATNNEIKKAFQALALKYHPDKGGNAELFSKIKNAHDILIDPISRLKYDKSIEDNKKRNFERGECTTTSTNSMSNASSKYNININEDSIRNERKWNQNTRYYSYTNVSKTACMSQSENITYGLSVTLEEIYNGSIREIEIAKKNKCRYCDRESMEFSLKNDNSHKMRRCDKCNGTGSSNNYKTMISHIKETCEICRGKGFILVNECRHCNNSGFINQLEKISINIEPGIEEKKQIIIHGAAGSINPNKYLPGDLIINITYSKHELFEVKNADLIYNKTIDVFEAICGLECIIKHLNGTYISFNTKPGEIVYPSQVKCIPGKGMPVHSTNERIDHPSYGNLYVKFNIKYPNHINEDIQNKLKEFLFPKDKNKNQSFYKSEICSDLTNSIIDINDLGEELKNRQPINIKKYHSNGLWTSDSNLSDSEVWEFDDDE